jgi:hypothetical protein
MSRPPVAEAILIAALFKMASLVPVFFSHAVAEVDWPGATRLQPELARVSAGLPLSVLSANPAVDEVTEPSRLKVAAVKVAFADSLSAQEAAVNAMPTDSAEATATPIAAALKRPRRVVNHDLPIVPPPMTAQTPRGLQLNEPLSF